MKRPYYGWYLVAVAFLSLFMSGGVGTAFSVLLPTIVEDTGWTYSTVIGASSLGVIAGSIAGPWVGRIIDRRGARLVMSVAIVITAASLAVLSQVQEPWQFFLAYGAVGGIARAALQNVAPAAIIANWFRRKRAVASGIAAMGPPASTLVLPAAIALVATNFSWRYAWVVLAVLVLVATLPPVALLVRRRPEDMGLRMDGDTEEEVRKSGSEEVGHLGTGEQRNSGARGVAVAGMARAAARVRVYGAEEDWTLHEAIHSRGFWGVVVFMALIQLMPNSVFLFLFSSMRAQGLSETVAAVAFSVMGLTQVVSRMALWTPLVLRVGVQPTIRTWAGLLLISALLLGLTRGEFMGYTASAVLGIAMGANMVLQLMVWPEYFGRTAVGAISGTAFVVSGLTGAAGPLISATIIDLTGDYTWAFLFMGASVGVGLLLQFVVGKPRRPARTPIIATT